MIAIPPPRFVSLALLAVAVGPPLSFAVDGPPTARLVADAWPLGAAPEGTLDDIDEPALAELGRLVRDFVTDGRIVGAELLVLHRGRVVLHEAVGSKDGPAQLPMERDTLFALRSMTKPMTGTLAAMSFDEGRLAAVDRLADHLPAFDHGRAAAITIEHLLTHRSGLPLSSLDRSLNEYRDLGALADQVASAELAFEPGERFLYSDSGSDALGAVLEAANDAPLDELLRRRLFEPLGMRDSFVAGTRDPALLVRTASAHLGGAPAAQRYWSPKDAPFYPFALGSQSVYSSPADFARFLALWEAGGELDGHRWLSADVVRRALEPVSATGFATGYSKFDVHYGRMWMLYVDRASGRVAAFGHSGSDGTYAITFPERGWTVLYFTSTRGQDTIVEFERAVDALLVHPDAEAFARLRGERAPDELAPYLGLYRADGSADYRAVVHDAGRLAVEVPGERVFRLVPNANPDEWRVELVPRQEVRFERAASGEVVALETSGPMASERWRRFEPAPTLPPASELMARLVRAHGYGARPNLGCLRLTGRRIHRTGREYPLEDLFDAGRQHQRLRLGERGVRHLIVADEQVLAGTAGEPPRVSAAAEAEGARAETLDALLGDWRAHFARLRVLYRRDLDGQDCWVIRAIPRVGTPVTRYQSVATGRLVAEHRIATVPGAGVLGVFTTWDQWIEVEGLWIPMRGSQRYDHPLIGTIVTQYDSVEPRVDLGEQDFRFPGEDEAPVEDEGPGEASGDEGRHAIGGDGIEGRDPNRAPGDDDDDQSAGANEDESHEAETANRRDDPPTTRGTR